MRSAFFITLLLPSAASAATLTVGPSGTYATIGAAVSAAVDDDTIDVEAGTYNEEVSVSGKRLANAGQGLEISTMIRKMPFKSVFYHS